MPRTRYHRDSGAFEIFATDDEVRMERLQRENDEMKFMLSQIMRAMGSLGMDLGTVDLESLDDSGLDGVASRLGIEPGVDRESTMAAIRANATPYQIWRAFDR